MEEIKIEEQEFMPGTNIPRPRYRDTYETDEQYVEYLKEYYSKYFPEVVETDIKIEENSEEINNSNIQNIDITDKEIETIQNNLENYANTIEENSTSVEKSTEIDEPRFDTSTAEDEDFGFSFDTSAVIKESKDVDYEFDLTSNPSTDNNPYYEDAEVESITNSNDRLNSKIKTQNFWTKVSTFFSNIKIGVKDYFAEASDSILDENLAPAGHIR